MHEKYGPNSRIELKYLIKLLLIEVLNHIAPIIEKLRILFLSYFFPMKVKRKVKWVQVKGDWTRMSVMTIENPMEVYDPVSKKIRINVLMVPGNCGNELFYEKLGREFLPLIYNEHREVYFYTVSHLNHVEMPTKLRHTSKHSSSHLFSLEEQVQHKMDFCDEFLPKNGKLFIFSHSIGCYIALRLLSYLIENGWDIGMSYAMFPVIEKMCETKNGKILKPIAHFMTNYDKLVKISTWWLNYTPMRAKKFLTQLCMLSWSIPQCVLTASGEAFRTNVMRNIAFITVDELKNICDLDPCLIKHHSYITFYYGHDDAWTHENAGMDMCQRVPKERVIFDEHKCEHVIVFKDNETMAKIMAKWVNNHMDPQLGADLSGIPVQILRRKKLQNLFL